MQVPELARLDEPAVTALRQQLDGIKVRGKNVPKPIKTFTQAGLHSRVLEALRAKGFEAPLPIQVQLRFALYLLRAFIYRVALSVARFCSGF